MGHCECWDNGFPCGKCGRDDEGDCDGDGVCDG